MPVADKFTALGAGNGFPYCVVGVDVGFAEKWTTLSGYNHNSTGAVTPEQIEESRRLAMAVFWNAYKLNVEIIIDGVNYISSLDTVNDSTTGDELTPHWRTCITGHYFFHGDSGMWIEKWVDTDEWSGVSAEAKFYVVKMYKDGEFVGFGLNGAEDDTFETGFELFGTGFQYMVISSFDFTEQPRSSGLCVLPFGDLNLHVVCSAIGYDNNDADLANMTWTQEFGDSSCTLSFLSLEPYTYPE